jgi:tripartite-type tricarboxylate transporter receptor subunit TctC
MIVAAPLVAAAMAPTAHAQNYPAKPVSLVLPFSPGGSIDLAARLLAQKLTERLGQSFIVENRPGAGTVIAASHVAKAAPDGHTVLVALSPLATNATLYKKLPYDTAKDFVPVARIADIPFVLVVHPSLPVRSIPELIKHAKDRAGKLAFASSGTGSTLHLAGELLKSMTGIQMTHIPYKGGPPALNDVVAGHVQLVFADPASAVPQIRAGKVRALGVSSLTRLPVLPDVPPISEAGLPGFEAVSWSLIVTPARTPEPVVSRLNTELRAIMAMPDVQARFVKFGMVPRTSPTPGELRDFLSSEIARWGKLVKQAGIAGSQ